MKVLRTRPGGETDDPFHVVREQFSSKLASRYTSAITRAAGSDLAERVS
jgi:hypothetical protein